MVEVIVENRSTLSQYNLRLKNVYNKSTSTPIILC